MNPSNQTNFRAALIATLLAFSPSVGVAQYISIKTVPVAAGDQFFVYPSENFGMAGVTIALDDRLLDPFVNPAMGSRLDGSYVLASPTFYSISNRGGASRSLPFAAIFGSDSWFGGVSLAMQQLEAPEDQFGFAPFFRAPSQQLLSEKAANNTYAFGMIGRKIPGSGVSVGGSFSWSNLNAVDGVDLLYALSDGIEQFGHAVDFRLGLLSEFAGGRSLQAVALHNRFGMTHNVSYLDWVVDDQTGIWTVVERIERNLDQTNTWGLHLNYDQPLRGEGWRIGGIVTGNYKSHPKIPNYELMNIPRDPGNSVATNFGVGISRQRGPVSFGMDLIYEPIWSDTWAVADADTSTASGVRLAAGAKTVENDFVFSNAVMRIGVGREVESFGFQLGLQVKQFSYRLHQIDRIAETERVQRESWMEWTPTWGLSLRYPEFEIRYAGSATSGTGRPGVVWEGARVSAALESGDIVLAPEDPLTLQDAMVVTHRVSVSIPIR